MATQFKDLFDLLQVKVTEIIACATDTNAIKNLAQLALDAINANKTASAAALQAMLDNSVIVNVVRDKWFADASLKIGTPDANLSSRPSTILGFFNGILKADGEGFGDLSSYPLMGTQAGLWIHIPITRVPSQMLSFELTIFKYNCLPEIFKCTAYLVNSTSGAYFKAEDETRFKCKYYPDLGKQYLSFMLISSYYSTINIDVSTGARGFSVKKSQLGTPEFSLSDTPTV